MLIRISLIVAIIAGLAVGALNFITVKQKVMKFSAPTASPAMMATIKLMRINMARFYF